MTREERIKGKIKEFMMNHEKKWRRGKKQKAVNITLDMKVKPHGKDIIQDESAQKKAANYRYNAREELSFLDAEKQGATGKGE